MSLQTCESRENNFGRATKPLFNQTRHETGSKEKKNYNSTNGMIWMFMKMLINKRLLLKCELIKQNLVIKGI